VQGDRDVFMIPGAKGNELDPIQDVYDYITKIGIDATKPLARAERFELAKIPGYDTIDLRDYLCSEGASTAPSEPPARKGIAPAKPAD
jgi:2,5-furandicarboxylate decarboxylase 1